METYQPTSEQLTTIRHYLEREFPDQVKNDWWDREARAHVFEVFHEHGRHHIVVDVGFLRHCPDYEAGLRESELVDYMREAHAQERRFLVLGEGTTVHVRSTAL